ncbi:MAG: FAD-dependent monooxygenase [Thermodesulfobacteriota bacterium]
MSKIINTDVLIVGAGPTGLTLACMLSRYGIDYIIIDKSSSRSTIPKASIMNARSMEILEDVGAIDYVLEVGLRINDLVMFAEGKKLAQSNYNLINSKYNYILNIGQPHTEKALEDRLIKLGSELKRDHELIEFQQNNKSIDAVIKDDQSIELNIKCKFMVGCDGARSFVRKKLNLEFEGKEYQMDNITGEVDIDWDFPRDQHLFSFTKDGAFIVYGMPDNRWLVWANMPLLEGNKSRYYEGMDPTFEELQTYFNDRCPYKAELKNVGWLTYYTTHERGVKNLRHGNIFLAGDAAHISSPASGQGMNTGIQDAHNLGFKIAYYLNGNGNEELLNSYENERKVFMKSRKTLSDMNEMVFGVKGHISQHVRNSLLRFLNNSEMIYSLSINEASQLSQNYRDSNIVEEFAGLPIHLLGGKHLSEEHLCSEAWLYFGKGPHAGDRLQECYKIENANGESNFLSDHLEKGSFNLLCFVATENPTSDILDEINKISKWNSESNGAPFKFHIILLNKNSVSKFDNNICVLIDPISEAHNKYGAKGECIYLIRPDGYVGYRSLPPDLERLQEHLQKFS